MIRPGGQASQRRTTKLAPGRCRLVPCVGACKWHELAIRWLMTGRREVSVRGLGRPAGKSGGTNTPAGDRDAVVVKKPGNAGGAKGVRKSEP